MLRPLDSTLGVMSNDLHCLHKAHSSHHVAFGPVVIQVFFKGVLWQLHSGSVI